MYVHCDQEIVGCKKDLAA